MRRSRRRFTLLFRPSSRSITFVAYLAYLTFIFTWSHFLLSSLSVLNFACACQTYGSLAQGAESYLLARWLCLAYACFISLGWSSRAQKIFNTGSALELLDRDGAVRASATTPSVTVRAIVDADLDETLRLL